LRTDDGGKLQIAINTFVPYDLTFGIKEREEETDILHSLVRLVDNRGVAWIGESIFHVNAFVYQMTNFGSRTHPTQFDKAPEEYKSIFSKNCFFEGARGLLDDRFYRKLDVNTDSYIVPFKYQAPILDLAFHYDSTVELVQLFAKVKGLYAHTSEDDRSPIDIPAIMFAVDFMKAIFVNYGYKDETGYWTEDIIPRPFVLEKHTENNAPQHLIQYINC